MDLLPGIQNPSPFLLHFRMKYAVWFPCALGFAPRVRQVYKGGGFLRHNERALPQFRPLQRLYFFRFAVFVYDIRA